MFKSLIWSLTAMALFASTPASTNYTLNNYGFGSGGIGNASSTNYSANTIAGEISGQPATSSNYGGKSGNNQSQQANVPPAPSFTNPGNYYDKLKFVLNNGNNPSDAKFAIAISTDNFATTKYVQPDDTISPTFSISDYQTYAAWGGASGQNVIGLQPSTTYYIKAKATSGKFTETQFGPVATAATVAPQLTYDIDVAATDSSTSPPYAVSFGSLLPGTVVTPTNKIWISLDTNADSGANVYVASQNGGLGSATASYTLASTSTDLASTNEGEGAQISSVAQSSGGPLVAQSPYNGSAQVVGILNSLARKIFSSSAPITGGRGSFVLKAKSQTSTPAANDYQDVLTLIAAGSF